MAKQTESPGAPEPITLTPEEREAVDRMRKTPAERAAELEARRQARREAMTPEQRQIIETREAKLAAMDSAQRRAYVAGRQLGATARRLRREADKGIDLAKVLAAQESADADAAAWLRAELAKQGS